MKKLFFIVIATAGLQIYSWSGKESSEGKNVNFYGTITTHEGQKWDVQNIAIGRDRESAHIKKITMYDKPAEQLSPSGNIIVLSLDPNDLTYSDIDLNEINALEVPNPEVMWIYKKDGSQKTGQKKECEKKEGPKYAIEYKEVLVTHKDGKKSSFLVELGRQDIPHKTKLFCSIKHKHKKGAQAQPKKESSVPQDEQKNGLFCEGVSMDELEEKGIPLQAIKKVTIEGYCHQVVVK
jgi:hypothetical protein